MSQKPRKENPKRRGQGSRCCEPPPASDSQEQPSLSHQSPGPRSFLPYLSSTPTSLKSLGKYKDSLGHALGVVESGISRKDIR